MFWNSTFILKHYKNNSHTVNPSTRARVGGPASMDWKESTSCLHTKQTLHGILTKVKSTCWLLQFEHVDKISQISIFFHKTPRSVHFRCEILHVFPCKKTSTKQLDDPRPIIVKVQPKWGLPPRCETWWQPATATAAATDDMFTIFFNQLKNWMLTQQKYKNWLQYVPIMA